MALHLGVNLGMAIGIPLCIEQKRMCIKVHSCVI